MIKSSNKGHFENPVSILSITLIYPSYLIGLMDDLPHNTKLGLNCLISAPHIKYRTAMIERNLKDKIISFPSKNYNERPLNCEIDILVIHYTGMPGASQALKRMCNPAAKVSAHYLVNEEGEIFQLISEKKRAWHAGISSWRNNSDINDRSIGIELANPGHEYGYKHFPEPQISKLIELAKDIIKRHPIPARNIIGHSDIAPTRKKDPGELFDWRNLALNGVGYWPTAGNQNTTSQINVSNFESALQKYGYETNNLTATIVAFQRHFLPENCNGQPNKEMFKMLENLTSNL